MPERKDTIIAILGASGALAGLLLVFGGLFLPRQPLKSLRLVLGSLQSLQQQVRAALRRGLTLEETQKSIDLDSIRVQFTHDDPVLNAAFQGNFVPIVKQMYDEATEGLEQYQ